MATVKQLVEQLERGELSVEQVEVELRAKSFSDLDTRVKTRDEIDITDVGHHDDDSLFYVTQANLWGRISDEDYDRLIQAATE